MITPGLNPFGKNARSSRPSNSAMPRSADGFYGVGGESENALFLHVDGGASFAIAASGSGPDVLDVPAHHISQHCVWSPSMTHAGDRPPRDWDDGFTCRVGRSGFQRISTPYRADEMAVVAVSPLVNSARVDDPRCCEPRPRHQRPLRNSKSPQDRGAGWAGDAWIGDLCRLNRLDQETKKIA